MSSAAVEALIDERIERFKLELSSIVHAAIEDALESYRRTLQPVHAPARRGESAARAETVAETVQGQLWAGGAAEGDPSARGEPESPGPGRPQVDAFWSEAAARIDERPVAPGPAAPGEPRPAAGRRTPEELEDLGRQVLAQLEARDGATMLAVARELGQPTSELRRPVQLLIAAGAIEQRSTAEGQRLYRR